MSYLSVAHIENCHYYISTGITQNPSQLLNVLIHNCIVKSVEEYVVLYDVIKDRFMIISHSTTRNMPKNLGAIVIPFLEAHMDPTMNNLQWAHVEQHDQKGVPFFTYKIPQMGKDRKIMFDILQILLQSSLQQIIAQSENLQIDFVLTSKPIVS
jgi:hypothetical protein